MEPLEEAVYLDQVRLLAVDHPADLEVYPNEYFASNPPYPEFKVVVSKSKDARPPAGAWDEHGHNVLPDLLAHRYFGDFALTQFQGFAQPHSLVLDLGEPYRGGPLWLLLHGEVEYFSANSMYAASQAGVQAISPYVEALVGNEKDGSSRWVRVIDDMGFPAGGPRTMTADLTGKLPLGTRKIRITTNLRIYWDSILVDSGQRRTPDVHLSPVPLIRADLEFHGFPLKIEGTPPGNVQYIYEKASATGPYTRPAGTYTRYGDVLPLLTALDDKLSYSVQVTRFASTSIHRNCLRYPRAGCAIISSRRTAMRKTWISMPLKATSLRRCRSSRWAIILIRRASRSRSTMRT